MGKIVIRPYSQSIPGPVFKVDIQISMSNLTGRVDGAQRKLDQAVMTHMVNYMPMVTGSFINLVKARSASVAGTGIVYAAAGPSGRFLYEGKGMVDEGTGSTWARKDAKKVLVSQYAGKTRAKEELAYTTTFHPKVTSHWFVPAKAEYCDNWVDIVNRELTKR